MKKMIAVLMMCVSGVALAHDEGHGPKISDTGRFGGLVSAVVLKSEAKKGATAALVYKAELVRSADGTARVYLYDTAMKPLDLKGFDIKGSATLAAKVKGKWKDTGFALELKDNLFIGKMPKVEKKPYNIDVTVKQEGRELLTAFDNLD